MMSLLHVLFNNATRPRSTAWWVRHNYGQRVAIMLTLSAPNMDVTFFNGRQLMVGASCAGTQRSKVSNRVLSTKY